MFIIKKRKAVFTKSAYRLRKNGFYHALREAHSNVA